MLGVEAEGKQDVKARTVQISRLLLPDTHPSKGGVRWRPWQPQPPAPGAPLFENRLFS